jgi:hypothetical protein
MTIDVVGLRELLAKATPGPWETDGHGIVGGETDEEQFIADSPDHAALIAAAVNTLPQLLEAWEERERLREALEPFADLTGYEDDDEPDDTKAVVRCGRTTDYSLTLGHIRRARTALHGGERP